MSLVPLLGTGQLLKPHHQSRHGHDPQWLCSDFQWCFHHADIENPAFQRYDAIVFNSFHTELDKYQIF